MAVDRRWIERNLGFDPIANPPPDTTFAFARAAKAETSADLEREVIDFDSESPAGLQFMAFTTATGLSRYDLANEEEWCAIFKRSPTPRAFQLVPLREQTIHFGEPVPVPATNGLIWASIEIKQRASHS